MEKVNLKEYAKLNSNPISLIDYSIKDNRGWIMELSEDEMKEKYFFVPWTNLKKMFRLADIYNLYRQEDWTFLNLEDRRVYHSLWNWNDFVKWNNDLKKEESEWNFVKSKEWYNLVSYYETNTIFDDDEEIEEDIKKYWKIITEEDKIIYFQYLEWFIYDKDIIDTDEKKLYNFNT